MLSGRGLESFYLQLSLSATKEVLGSWDWGRRAEEEEEKTERTREAEAEGRWSRVNRGWRVLSRWLEKLRAAPHGNWQKCQQLAQLLAEKFPKIVSIKIS